MSEIRFGSYRITDTLASGAIATIHKAVHEGLGRTVVLKTLKSQIAATSSFGEQLDREAKILADIVHPNVVLVLEAGRNPSGRPYIVLEHVDGPSLHALLTPAEASGPSRRAREKPAKKQTVDVPAALAIACAICSALEHIHDRGVVHRDLKPSNVLVSRTGHVKLIDFGIAQRPRTAGADAIEGITPSGRITPPDQLKDAFGTPAYMSPEQILGDFVDGRSDLFSLGVILYQMLSGSRPFDAPGEGDAKRNPAQRIRRESPAPLRERAPHCPRAVERIVMRLLEKSPADRYPSAAVVKERLDHALRAETREDPASLIREALAEGGHRAKSSVIGRAKEPSRRASAPMGLPRALAGYGAIAVAFVLGIVAVEGTHAQTREALAAGSQTLPLAPEGAGGLRVVATPWAHVRVDGQQVETTPFARPIPLSAGKHFITLIHPEAPPVEREVTIASGETVTLDVTMSLGDGRDAGKETR